MPCSLGGSCIRRLWALTTGTLNNVSAAHQVHHFPHRRAHSPDVVAKPPDQAATCFWRLMQENPAGKSISPWAHSFQVNPEATLNNSPHMTPAAKQRRQPCKVIQPCRSSLTHQALCTQGVGKAGGPKQLSTTPVGSGIRASKSLGRTPKSASCEAPSCCCTLCSPDRQAPSL